MHYISTRDNMVRLTSAEAISQGLSREGGLFIPEIIPHITENTIKSLCNMSYQQRAVYIMREFLDDYTTAELTAFAEKAYSPKGFDTSSIAPTKSLNSNTAFLELWHGPTCAFKDMALQMLPHLLSAALRKTNDNKDVCILVATSGDTGKAALEGFCNVPRTKIMVFYPQNGVSDVQKLQMTSQSGDNVNVIAIKGNFDDAQTGVKNIFSDTGLRQTLADRGWFLSSANSIHWGRLLPQIVYYFSSYCDLVNCGTINIGDKINFCVPTGNFGDILAGYYAKRMGLSISKLICASNKNDVLTEFINTGVYNKNREFYTTISPSMDILVSSNLERLIYHVSSSATEVSGYMNMLTESGRYCVGESIKASIKADFFADSCADDETKKIILDTYKKENYLIDTHTAVAYGVLKKYRDKTNDDTYTVVVSTASPYKFADSVLSALGETAEGSGIDLIDQLENVTNVPAPYPLASLRGRIPRFNTSVDKSKLLETVKNFLI